MNIEKYLNYQYSKSHSFKFNRKKFGGAILNGYPKFAYQQESLYGCYLKLLHKVKYNNG